MQTLPQPLAGLGREFYAYVYFKPNGSPFYIGKGSGRRATDLVRNRNVIFKNIIAKYGDKVTLQIFPCDSEKESFIKERELIASFIKLGFDLANLTEGGEGPAGLRHSDKSRELMSKKRKGRKFTDDHKKAISIALTGRIRPAFTPEWIEKIRIASLNFRHTEEAKLEMSKRLIGNKLALGVKRGPMSDEQKLKISASKKGTTPWNKGVKK